MSRISRWPNGGLWVWVIIGRGAVDRCDGFAFVEVFRCGFVCVCVFCLVVLMAMVDWDMGFCLSVFLLSSH